mmetsp:Transcript_9070/g.15545  ORF Transcript_9070/g.15545 Transcript_9070/m.15545 type:complete len:865 (+) Transcript_9070:125-2719(+)
MSDQLLRSHLGLREGWAVAARCAICTCNAFLFKDCARSQAQRRKPSEERGPSLDAVRALQAQKGNSTLQDASKQQRNSTRRIATEQAPPREGLRHAQQGNSTIPKATPAHLGKLPLPSVSDAKAGLDEPAYFSDLSRANSPDIVARWSRPRICQPLKEYDHATNTFCLNPQWVGHTRLVRYLQATSEAFKADRSLQKEMSTPSTFDAVSIQAIKKGYRLRSDSSAADQKDLVHNCNVLHKMKALYQTSASRQPYLTYAVQILVKLEHPDAIVAKLSEVCDRAERCTSAQRQAFNLLVAHSFHLLEVHEHRADDSNLDSREGAFAHVLQCLEDFLDDHKERAFKASFMEPTRLYFDLVGDSCQRDHVNVHGLNWYLAFLHSALGVQVPLLPEYNDPHVMGFADFWKALEDEAWQCFSDPVHFGADFEGISKLKQHGRRLLKQNVPRCQFPAGHATRSPKQFGNDAVNPAHECSSRRCELAIYAERFAHFFNHGFFLRKALETLNSEVKPEHAGFRKACETLYGFYRSENCTEAFPIDQATFLEYCYVDEYFMELDIARVADFFAWLGVVKPMAGAGTGHKRCQGQPKATFISDSKVSKVTCPICFEEKDDVEVLEHWQPQGDVSGHKMCGDCRRSYDKNQCPFCKDVLLKDELLALIKNLVDTVSKQTRGSDASARAAIYERWQLFEMEFEAQPAVVRRVAKFIVEHPHFAASLDRGVQRKQEWLRDAAGIVFRFYGMCEDGEIVLPDIHSRRLKAAIEVILEPFERPSPVVLDAHFYGALYTQSLVPWPCAWRSGASSRTLLALVQRTGRAVVHCLDRVPKNERERRDFRRRVPERMQFEYIQLARVPVWGSQKADPIWNAFYT